MELKQATCPTCGSNLEVDSGKDAAICPVCGNAYIVEKAINNYNTYNNTYNNVVNNFQAEKMIVQKNAKNNSERNRLYEAAEAYIKLDDIEKALEIYLELIEKYPGEWRGRRNAIYYGYGYDAISNLADEELQQKLWWEMDDLKKLAPPAEYQKLAQEMNHRIEKARLFMEGYNAEQAKKINKRLSEAKQSYDKAKAEWEKTKKTRERVEEAYGKYDNIISIVDGILILAALVIWIAALITVIVTPDLYKQGFFMCTAALLVMGAILYGIVLLIGKITRFIVPGRELIGQLEFEKLREEKAKKVMDNFQGNICDLENELKKYY